jgi:formylglycine-generating enzyme required for sulfatase activity
MSRRENPLGTKSSEIVYFLNSYVEIRFVLIPAGEFFMGSDPFQDPEACDDEMPQHPVYLDEYWIGKYPVTVEQFRVFAQSTGYQTLAERLGRGWIYDGEGWKDTAGANWMHPDGPDSSVIGQENHPVTHITYEDALEFCKWLSQLIGKEVRLPTEAEWEKAARGVDGRKYPWGNGPLDDEHCHYGKQIPGIITPTTPVDKYSPFGDSPYGVSDMAGNVFEWTADWYSESYYAVSPYKNPSGPLTGTHRVLRGGSRYFDRRSARTTHRNKIEPDSRDTDLGFRCVCID